jgi:hypothetical protein
MWRTKFEEKELRAELPEAQEMLKDEDVEFIPVFKNYILFKIQGKDFRVVAYPHKTSAGNRHVRVRNEGSKNIKEAERIMDKLYELSGNNCRYQRKAK